MRIGQWVAQRPAAKAFAPTATSTFRRGARHRRHAGQRAVRQRKPCGWSGSSAIAAALSWTAKLYGEDRQNGTPLQINDTTIRQLAFGTDYDSASAGLFTLRLYGGTQNYQQTFSSIAANRDSESLTNLQHVPVQQMGLIGQWSKQLAIALHHAGRTRRHVRAGRQPGDIVLRVAIPTAHLSNGGTQEALGAFLEGIVQITPRWSLTLAGREDLWSNYDASSIRIPVHGSAHRH